MADTQNNMDIRQSHYEQYFGTPCDDKIHSTDSEEPKVNVYPFPPTFERPYWTLITGGMSDRDSFQPDDLPDYISTRTELVMYVEEPQDWMFGVMKRLALMPFKDETFLHWWHTVPNGRPLTDEPSLLTNCFFMPPYFEQDGFGELEIDGHKTDVLWLVPITDAELQYKVDRGAEMLEDRLSEKEMDIVVREGRDSYV